ncbi:sulfide/dihydroorotate dehydrogenase-like FAD/NAD-binding protein [uncultured Mailhella sp.]|uniref:sulfide/dihydroorotate dehydrogenase-like FAD/NAD-binding protein n=1 Tax=uncultured Mailhella sp. TaxID=1981031 RepID=UPI0025F356A0|nr:sulfide/dihydroorotate dehydrogenase-like FAD/NAD-binding protein [uncultured Mailhella sp.]
MPTKILHKEKLIPGRTSKLVLDAPQIAATARPGHFVILRVDGKGERFPLTIADTDKEHGTITIVYLVLGRSTQMLEELEEGQEILDVCGPLGRATQIETFPAPKKVICVGGGTGVAAMHHIAKGHHEAGNYVIACIGARNKDLLLFQKELSLFCDEVLVSTDDGSEGQKGIVTDLVRGRLDSEGGNIAEVVAVGPVPMMQAVADLTRGYNVPTTVSLNSLMVDGLGMCGACRVTVGGEMKFTCVDGPEFDGHKVDFAELRSRLGSFRTQEAQAREHHRCNCFERKEA